MPLQIIKINRNEIDVVNVLSWCLLHSETVAYAIPTTNIRTRQELKPVPADSNGVHYFLSIICVVRVRGG